MSDENQPYIGGQAVIEGVMMRAPGCLSVAVRRPDGTIAVKEGPFKSGISTAKIWKLPGFRGVATLVESLRLGFGALTFSAEQQMTEEELEEQAGSGSGAIWLSVLIAISLFVALPQALATWGSKAFGVEFALQDTAFHLVIGGFKLLIFVMYLAGISMISEVRRVFQYHGAEHKTINAYEQGLELTVANVQSQTTMHPRCGTTFLVIVVILSIVAGSVATPILLPNAEGILGHVATLLLRIALLPVIAAVSFELQRFSARFCTTGPLRVLLYPGFLFQKITTREPDDDQVEIAIAAMKTAEWREGEGAGAEEGDEPLLFPSFNDFIESLPRLRTTAESGA